MVQNLECKTNKGDNNMKKTHEIDLFATDEVGKQYRELKPFKDCKKCDNGILLKENEVCECSIETVLKLIANIPLKYDVNIKLSKPLQKQLKEFKKFLIITGEHKYTKLLAAYLAKRFIKEDDYIIKYVQSKGITIMNSEDMIGDMVAFNKADVVIFEDVFKKASNNEYRFGLLKRIDNNKITIIVGKTDLVPLDDDFIEIEIDAHDIEVI